MDRESITPLYEQLAAILRGRIKDKTYTGRIPSEWDLAEEFGVSRATVRKATAIIISEGLAGISRGRGMYVLRRPK